MNSSATASVQLAWMSFGSLAIKSIEVNWAIRHVWEQKNTWSSLKKSQAACHWLAASQAEMAEVKLILFLRSAQKRLKRNGEMHVFLMKSPSKPLCIIMASIHAQDNTQTIMFFLGILIRNLNMHHASVQASVERPTAPKGWWSVANWHLH